MNNEKIPIVFGKKNQSNYLHQFAQDPIESSKDVAVDGKPKSVANSFPLSISEYVIGALVKRLGGNVTITQSELDDKRGVIIAPTEDGVEISIEGEGSEVTT